MYNADILFSRSPNQSWNLVDCDFLSFKMWLLLLSFVSWNVSEHFCFTEIILGWRITLFTVISTTTATMFADICVKSVCKWVIAWSSDTTCHIWVNLISKGQSYLWFFFFDRTQPPASCNSCKIFSIWDFSVLADSLLYVNTFLSSSSDLL